MAVLAERVVGLARRLQIFAADRHVSAAQRLQRVVARHQARIIRGDAERQRSLMADHRVALVRRQLEDALELGKRPDARACLPAPVIPLGELDLRVEALAERARHRPDGEALGAQSERNKMRTLGGRARGRESFDGKMWFGKKLRCRLRATGRLFGLELEQVHGICVPSVLFWTAVRQPPILRPLKARVISSTCSLISSANGVAVATFLPRRAALSWFSSQ
jgi:hypothetical protein